MNEERIERQAWLGVAFFAGLGALVLLLDQAAVIGGISLAAALLAAGALLARRRSRPAWHPNPDRADSPDNPIPRALPPQVRGHDRGAASPAPAPALSPEGQGRVAELVVVLGRAGVFAPEVPDPQVLEAAVASRGEPVTAQDLLLCLGEVGYGVPEADTSRYSANLAHHENQVEQWSDTLLEQVADLARLAGGTVAVEVLGVDQRLLDVPLGGVHTRLELAVGGPPPDHVVLDYRGLAKYLSTVLHVELARALRRAGAPRRLAWLREDAILLTGLPPHTDLNRLNADLGLPPSEPLGWGGWTWVDECEPEALGEDGEPAATR